MPLLEGKTGIIFGVANKRSIAWAIAQALSREGMRLAFTYQGERLKESVEELTAAMSGSLLLPCDVTNDGEIDSVFNSVEREFGKLDTLVHSVAFAPREDLENEFVKTSRDGFKMAQDISAYSLVVLTRAALPLMEKAGGGSVIAMTYYGAEKAVEGYNLMGVAKASPEGCIRFLGSRTPPLGSIVTPSALISVAAGRFSAEIIAAPAGETSNTPALCGLAGAVRMIQS